MHTRTKNVGVDEILDGASNTISMSEILTRQGGTSRYKAGTQKDYATVHNGGNALRTSNSFPNSILDGITAEQVEDLLSQCDDPANKITSSYGIQWYNGNPAGSYISTLTTPNARHYNCAANGAMPAMGGIGGNTLFGARSLHPGGVNALMADGKVFFLSEAIDWDLYQNMGGREEGGVVEKF